MLEEFDLVAFFDDDGRHVIVLEASLLRITEGVIAFRELCTPAAEVAMLVYLACFSAWRHRLDVEIWHIYDRNLWLLRQVCVIADFGFYLDRRRMYIDVYIQCIWHRYLRLRCLSHFEGACIVILDSKLLTIRKTVSSCWDSGVPACKQSMSIVNQIDKGYANNVGYRHIKPFRAESEKYSDK